MKRDTEEKRRGFQPVKVKFGELQRVTTIPHEQPTHEVLLAALGEPLLFQTNYEPFVAAAVDTFGRFPAPPKNKEPLVVQIFVRSGNQPETASAPRPRLVVHNQRHLVYLSVGAANTAVADLHTGFAFAMLDPALASDVPFVRYAFIEALPQVLLGGRGYVPIHAACVVKNGVSLMLCAPAGTGKSTLALACLRHGYQILAEDVVQVHVPPPLQLWGIPWKFHLLPDAMRFFPELTHQQPHLQTNGEWKLELDLDKLYPGSTITQASVGRIIFLERDPARPLCLEPLSLEAARAQFEPIWSWDLPWPPMFEQQLGQLLGQGVYRLHMNGSPDEAIGLLNNLVKA